MNQSIHKLISNLDKDEFYHIADIINYKYDPKKKLGRHDSIVYFIIQTSNYRHTDKVTKEEKLNIFFINFVSRLIKICLKDNICKKYNINRRRVIDLKFYIKDYLSSKERNRTSTDFCINIAGRLPLIFKEYGNLLRNSINFKLDLNKALNQSINKINEIICFDEKKDSIFIKISNSLTNIEKENRNNKKLFEIALIIYINEYKRGINYE